MIHLFTTRPKTSHYITSYPLAPSKKPQVGAALFYTSSHKPATIDTLRKYIKHRLFTTTSSQSSSTETSTNTNTSNNNNTNVTTTSSTYPFTERAQVIDRDIMVPAGWDSWTKIKLLRESFNIDLYTSITSSDAANDIKMLVDKVTPAYAKVVVEKRDPGQVT